MKLPASDRALHFALAWALACACGDVASADAPQPASVLVVFSNSRLLPANIDVDRGLETPSDASPQRGVRLFAEFLDAPAFLGESYEADTALYLRRKYAARPPEVIVAGGSIAIDFLLRHRAELFPGSPIVHLGVDRQLVNARTPLPADVVGIPVDYDIAGTLRLALRLQPSTARVVVVTGSTQWDRGRQADARRAVSELGLSLPVDYLHALAQEELLDRLAHLQRDSIVFTTGYFADGAGVLTTPKESVQRMAEASAVPVYAVFSSQLGTGAIGGRMASYEEMGRAARGLVDRLLAGTSVTLLRVPASMPSPPQLDWRQVRRWNIPDELVPEGSVVHYRTPTLWETYRAQVVAASVIVMIQTGLILALLIERRRRRRTAAALADSERRMGLAVDAARLSTFAWRVGPNGSSGGHRDAPALDVHESIAERSLRRELGRIHPNDRDGVEAAVRRAVAEGTELDIEYRLLDDDGRAAWFAARGRVAAAGNGSSLTGVRMDITARKEAQLEAEADRAALRRLSRVSTMGQLSAAIAHQLNQPLAAILGNAETVRKMLDRKHASVDEMREILDDIITEDTRAAQVIRRLGDLYRRGDAEFTKLDVNELTRETIELLRTEFVMRHVAPFVMLRDGLPLVSGNRIQLQQVLLNLILNASDAVADAAPELRSLLVRTSLEGGSVRLCVIDRGAGIAERDLPRVFDPFWTTKEHGLGVGLAICSAIAGTHHGTLTATNNPEGGATFCLALPADTAIAEETPVASRVPGR